MRHSSCSPEKEVISEDFNHNDDYVWLKNNIEPWNDVQSCWRRTFSLRNKSLTDEKDVAQIYEDWPILRNPLGYTLIEDDFKRIYPENYNNLLLNFEQVVAKVIELRQTHLSIRDKPWVEIFKSTTTTDDYKSYTALLLLSALIPCTTRLVKKKKQWKPNCDDAINGIIIKVENIGDIDAAIRQRKQEHEKSGLPVQPYMIVEIEGLDVKQIVCIINGNLYLVPSIKKGIDTCFKFTMVLNLKYTAESEHLWYFIQRAIYNIETKYDHKIPAIISIVNQLKTFK
ncbi:uncharacterized protein LOC116159563 [Photinus pyralis]|nr:uncharacterized protein LOC116159450 [Photinus pyralis]XP_031328430.1 uncharacterized protein LOC116159563 [Photinus pyralis]